MATTITTIHPPATKTALAWNWQDQQTISPLADQPQVTLAAGLKTGTRADAGTTSNPPLYKVTGVTGIYGPGGSAANGASTAPVAPTDAGTTKP